MKKTALLLLLSIVLLLPVSAGPSHLEAGIYHASEIDYLYLLDAADGTQIAQFITTDGLSNETFSLTAQWNGMEGSLVKNGQTIRFTAELQDDGAIYINQDVFLFEELSGFYLPANKQLDITESTAIMLIEHIPAISSQLGEHPQWTVAPALVNNLFYSLTAEGNDRTPMEFLVLRNGKAIFRMDASTPQIVYGSLQDVLNTITDAYTEMILPFGLDLYAHPLQFNLPDVLHEGQIDYSSSDPAVVRINSQGLLLPRSAGSAEIHLSIVLGDETARISLPITITNSPMKGLSDES